MTQPAIRLLAALACLAAAATAAASTFDESYTRGTLTMDDGLNCNFVDHMFKDEQGFVWIATGGGGLARFDGYDVINYDINTTPGLKSNFVHRMCTDTHGRMWVASEGGIDVIDLAQNTNCRLAGNTDRILAPMHSPAHLVMRDASGNIWFAGGQLLVCIGFDSDGSVGRTSITQAAAGQQFTTMAIIGGRTWVATEGRIFEARPDGTRIALTPTGIDVLPQLGTVIYNIYQKDNEIWIGTSRGLARHGINSDNSKLYVHSDTDTRSISQNFITDISEMSTGQMVFATLKGLNIYDPITDTFERLAQDDSKPNSLSCNFVNCLLRDGETLWVGTEVCGIDRFTPCSLTIRNFSHSTTQPASISPNPVNSVIQDKDGNLWVGTVEGGLNMQPHGRQEFRHFTTVNGLIHNSVSALAIDADNRLWIGTWGGGVCVMDLGTQRIVGRITPETHPQQMRNEFVGGLQYDPINDGVWITTINDICFWSDRKLTNPIPESYTAQMAGSLGIGIDRSRQLWIGTSNGLLIVDLQSMKDAARPKYRHLKYKLDNQQSKLVERVTCICPARDGSVWIGSDGFGFYRYDGRTFVNYNTHNGLSNNSVRGIAEDADGNLWIGTDNGLSLFDTKIGTFSVFKKSNGLPSNSFYWNAAASVDNGRAIALGTTCGLSIVSGVSRDGNQGSNRLTFTRLTVLNEVVRPDNRIIDRDIATATDIYIHEKYKSFSIEFSALNFTEPNSINYRYRLRNFDDWNEVPAKKRVATYTNIPPGDYVFEVQFSNGKNQWSEPTTVSVHIEPFFYKTIWFFALLFTILIVVMWQYYNIRTRALNEQKKLLHLQVEERTRRLSEQTALLENKTAELESQNKLLMAQNQKITQQKETLLRMSNKIQKLTVDKLAFFTNISHEFRTPITLIIGPIERALRLSTNPKVVEQLQFVERSSKQLLQLVNQLMDFRKIESGNMEIHRDSCNIRELVLATAKPFAVFAGERNVRLKCFVRRLYNPIMIDIDNINKVITNLLSNAIKFTPDNGTVSVYVTPIIDDGLEKLYICVRDSGIGIPEKDIENIFNRFYQSYNQIKYPVYGQSGTGIGLYLCKRIVELHDGTIEARNYRQGCAFRIKLPLIEADEATDQADAPATPMPDEPAPAPENRKNLTIMVVEDNPDMRAYLRSILCEQYNVVEAANGRNALNVMAGCEVNFIICDLMMPVMDGLEFAGRIKENIAFSHIPIIILTAQMSDDYRTDSYRIGVESYICKPFDEKMLLARIADILSMRKNYQQKFSFSMNVDELNIERESSDDKFIRQVMECVKANYANAEFEVNDIIKEMHCSKSLLNKKMNSLIGQTTGQFIRNYRLSTARELIAQCKETKAMNVSQIAYEVGFNDPKYFTRCFTKHFGVNPSVLLYGEAAPADDEPDTDDEPDDK